MVVPGKLLSKPREGWRFAEYSTGMFPDNQAAQVRKVPLNRGSEAGLRIKNSSTKASAPTPNSDQPWWLMFHKPGVAGAGSA